MNDYEIIPEPTPRSRLARPSIIDLSRRVIRELERLRVPLSARERTQLDHLRSLLGRLIEDEVQID